MAGRLTREEPVPPDLPPVYPISSGPAARRRGHLSLIQEFLEAGARLVQVREKHMPDDLLLKSLGPIRRACHRAGARLILNDRPRLALEAGADGVHLGQTDAPAEEARRLLGASALIGLSTHNRHQFDKALLEAPVDYLSVGPIFPTTGKEDPDPVVGLEELRRLVRRTSLPVVAIGGIRLDRSIQTWAAGARTLAVISDICEAPSPGAQVRRYLQLWERHVGCS